MPQPVQFTAPLARKWLLRKSGRGSLNADTLLAIDRGQQYYKNTRDSENREAKSAAWLRRCYRALPAAWQGTGHGCDHEISAWLGTSRV